MGLIIGKLHSKKTPEEIAKIVFDLMTKHWNNNDLINVICYGISVFANIIGYKCRKEVANRPNNKAIAIGTNVFLKYIYNWGSTGLDKYDRLQILVIAISEVAYCKRTVANDLLLVNKMLKTTMGAGTEWNPAEIKLASKLVSYKLSRTRMWWQDFCNKYLRK
eukprot:TRINITY_DN3374_c0_g1_i1.p1 TRINITY_DN3374_c0_g1~~TRINITY_DN3374_c0_g1_i1.p1  ORF type:complete len:163 (-),score=13.46 TRINITY_DN3374_c0_g1_i1:29-517(-)